MIDSIRLSEIIDTVRDTKSAIHPAVRKIHNPSWTLSLYSITPFGYGLLAISMEHVGLIPQSGRRFRYKWFQRVVDMLNKHGEKCEIVFVPDIANFECRLSGGVLEGHLFVRAYQKSVLDQLERLGEVVSPAGLEAVSGPFPPEGWESEGVNEDAEYCMSGSDDE